LRQHLIGERIAGAEITQRYFEIIRIAHEPDAAACGADRGLDHGRKTNGVAQRACGFHDPRQRLRQLPLIEQPAESGLAVGGAIALE
jgi:hypothetical protein